MGKLTALQVAKATGRCLLNDGNGLYLQVSARGAKSWIYRFRVNGKLRDHGLGSLAALSLAEARDRAYECRKLRLQGIDPIEEARAKRIAGKKEAARSMTFKQCCELFIDAKKSEWRNAKHRAQWGASLKNYTYPVFGDLPVGDIETPLVVKVLRPIWEEKTETARRLRGRIEKVLDWAKVNGYRDGDNPAAWRGNLAMILPQPSKIAVVHHYPALPHPEIKAFWNELGKQGGTATKALRFTILTAVRTSETLNATWDEVDFEKNIWTIPASRMKAGKEHRVPLSSSAVAILKQMQTQKVGVYIFPGARAGKPLSNMAMTTVLRRMGRGDIKTHGFRSTFRDWAAELSGAPREVAEHALAHKLLDKVEAAYFRSDLFDKRKQLMADWATYCVG